MIQSAGKVAIAVLVAATIVAGAGFVLSNSQANSGVSSTSSFLVTSTRTITETANVSATQMPTSTGSCGIILGTGGPVYLKVTSDQGSPIINGSVAVLHNGPVVNGVSCGAKTYRVPLKPLTNGYTVVSVNDSLPTAGRSLSATEETRRSPPGSPL